MPEAIVTGATGFVGSHLVDLLLERGWRVTVTARPTSDLRWLEGKPVERRGADFSAPLPECDVLFHVAGVIRADSYPDYLDGNRELTRRVLATARTKRFVHVSTLAVVGPGRQVDETTPCAPISMYGKSKWEGEQVAWARREEIPLTVVRPPVVYGPRDFGLFEMYKAISKGIRPEIGGPKEISLVHARDLAEGILRAAEAPEGAGEIFLMANRETWPVSKLLDVIQKAMGKKALKVRVPDRVVRFLGALAEDGAKFAGKRTIFGRDKALEMTQEAWTCSPEKARRILGWEARVPVEAGMEEALEWYRSRKLL